MAERSKALRSGRSPLLWAWVRIPLLTVLFFFSFVFSHMVAFTTVRLTEIAEWRSGSVLGP